MMENTPHIGNLVTMEGYKNPAHIFGGIIAKVIELRQCQNASDDEWHWSAYLEYSINGELERGWYPVKFLTHYQGKLEQGRLKL